jgi:hypothetical protein
MLLKENKMKKLGHDYPWFHSGAGINALGTERPDGVFCDGDNFSTAGNSPLYGGGSGGGGSGTNSSGLSGPSGMIIIEW